MAPPGDHHRHIAADIPNPFGEDVPRISSYTAREIAILQSRLDKQLGPEYISARSGPGGSKVHYITAEKVINLANEVFGFNGWSSGIREVTIDYCDVDKNSGKISMGCSIIVRVTLRDGTYHEDVGYGSIVNCNGKGPAFEKTKKEAATDALKRALRSFGNILGNCLYDKEYLGKVTKLKVLPSRWGEENLHRHQDFAPIKREVTAQNAPTESDIHTEINTSSHTKQNPSIQSHASLEVADYDDEYGGNLFEEVDFHPDEVTLVETSMMESDTLNVTISDKALEVPAVSRQPMLGVQSGPGQPQGGYQPGNSTSANQAQVRQQMQQKPGQIPSSNMSSRPLQNSGRMQPPAQQTDQKAQPQQRPPYQQLQQSRPTSTPERPAQNNPRAPQQHVQQQQQGTGAQINTNNAPIPHDAPVGFITARGAEIAQASNVPLPQGVPIFNPHADSPSIRKTSGVNHNRSGPVTRQTVGVAPPLALPNLPHAANSAANSGTGSHAASIGGAAATGGVVTPNRPGNANFINPQADVNRRIGMPPGAGLGMQSPVANRSAYKPPGPAGGVKRAVPQDGGAARAALADVSNLQGQQQGDGDGIGDGKRLKVDGL